MSTMTDLKDPVDQDIGGKKVDVHSDGGAALRAQQLLLLPHHILQQQRALSAGMVSGSVGDP